MPRSVRPLIVTHLVKLSSRNYSICALNIISKTRTQWVKWSVFLYNSCENMFKDQDGLCFHEMQKTKYLHARSLTVCDLKEKLDGMDKSSCFVQNYSRGWGALQRPVSHRARVQRDEEAPPALSNERSSRLAQTAGIMGSHMAVMINMVSIHFWYNVKGLNVKCIQR